MRISKRVYSVLLALVMALTMIPSVAGAATKDSIPKKVRSYGTNERAIEISLADPSQSIDNIKSSSKNMVVMLTGADYNYEDRDGVSNKNYRNDYYIGVRSKKNGTYKVTFDIIDENKKKVETKTVEVYAYDYPVKSITFDGKKYNGELSGKSAKVKVTLASGNTIKKLEYGVYKLKKENENNSSSEMAYTTFKNGGKVTFGTRPYYYSNEYSNSYDGYTSQYSYFNTGMNCPTTIKITYYDKYTKQNETVESYFYKYVD
ncbi:hypothetical protein H0486_16430 [Lachnospiraceae bacterium MD1]|uniref:Uncharacterized protein n=1 Tax=Variimorphobacter saccharofermentans TaxID=2755051 RepID=A0A839K546_9FIRM|nr:hypothetical protein [Variimorphobacter saccharofermentans]MBB2184467.1 hypothetical protein [Variimorphobacter saccharofermentans]